MFIVNKMPSVIRCSGSLLMLIAIFIACPLLAEVNIVTPVAERLSADRSLEKSTQPVYFHISRQSLSAALHQFARQAKIQILFSPELVTGRYSHPLFGYHSVEQALMILLTCEKLAIAFNSQAAAIKAAAKPMIPCQQPAPEQNTEKVPLVYSHPISEMVVTARRRKQNPQSLGGAINVIQASDIRQAFLAAPKEIANYSASVTAKNVLNKAAPIFSIRGISNTAYTSNSVSPVGIYMDDLFIPSHSMLNFPLLDIERIEILKGPQGSLFGRNTTAGAIHFVSQKPVPDEEAEIQLGIADHDTASLRLIAGGHLFQQLSGRLALYRHRQKDGYFTDMHSADSDQAGVDAGETLQWALRAGLRWYSESLDVYWNVHAGKEQSDNEPWVGIGTRNGAAVSAVSQELPHPLLYLQPCYPLQTTALEKFMDQCVNLLGYRDPYPDLRQGEFSYRPELNNRNLGSVLTVNAILPHAEFSTVSAYEKNQSLIEEDFDGGPFVIGDTAYANDLHIVSQEFRWLSRAPLLGKTDWMLGTLFYLDNIQVRDVYGYRDRVNHDVSVSFDQSTRSWAFWGHTETRLGDHWNIIAGLRYTLDKIHFDGGTRMINPGPGFVGEATFFSSEPLLADDQSRSSEFTGKLGLEYRYSNSVLLYSNYHRGYKAGVWNGMWTIKPGDHTPTNPEFINAYELGFKSQWIHNTVQLNAAAYYYDYKDMQVFSEASDSRFTVANVKDTDICGLELDIVWLPSDNIRLQSALSYNRARINGSVGTQVFKSAVVPNAPAWSFNTLLRYQTVPVPDLIMFLQMDAAYQSDIFFSLDNHKAVSEGDYTIANFNMGIAAADHRWRLSFWVKNLNDKDYFTEILHSGSAGLISAQVGSPRTLGVEFSYRWQ